MPYDIVAKHFAKEFVTELRAKTVCVKCGNQPIEWHHESHLLNSNRRISHMAALGFPTSQIKEEIAKCEALCRSCHMKSDGRLEKLQENCPNKFGTVFVRKKPCIECGELYKPLRRGLCNKCNHKQRKGLL